MYLSPNRTNNMSTRVDPLLLIIFIDDPMNNFSILTSKPGPSAKKQTFQWEALEFGDRSERYS